MADIELVIKIPEEDYKSIKDDVKKFLSMPSHKVPVLYEAVNNGTPLPKGHGRLGDLDALRDIEELIENLTTIRNKICPGKYETETSLTFEQTLAALHKYQKIEQIISDGYLQGKSSGEMLLGIKEVME